LRSAFEHSFVLIFFYAVIPVTLALVLVGALSRAQVRGQAGFRTVLFLPQVIPLVVVAVIWRMIYAPDGPLNSALDAIGLGSLARPWLGDFTWALPSIGFVGTWVMSGLALVLFMAGVQKIPQSLYDAARVDGAGPLREFFAVTLPNLRGEIAVALTLTTIAALRNFDLVYITTQGGPGNATSVPSFQVYNRAFQIGQIGSACAVGFTLACVIFVLAFAITRVADRGQA
jgi:raffinose/stachyose/melibiose transport system permease protein